MKVFINACHSIDLVEIFLKLIYGIQIRLSADFNIGTFGEKTDGPPNHTFAKNQTR
jgi:hypothetical protein